MTDESIIKENIVQLMSQGSGAGTINFLQSIAYSRKITYADELKFLDSKITLVSKYKETFSNLLSRNVKILSDLKKKSIFLEKELGKKQPYSKNVKLIKENNDVSEKLGLVETEIEHLKRMSSVLEDVSIEHKESLNRIKRKIERSSLSR